MYTKDFQKILASEKDVATATMYILKNDNLKKIKVFPEVISDVLLNQYFKTLESITKENRFVDFIPDMVDKATLQVISTDLINLWSAFLTAKNELSLVNRKEIEVDDYRCEGNVTLLECILNDGQRIYFLSSYRNVSSWYSNNTRFKKDGNGKFHHEEGDILALTPYVDVVIYGKRCYIINESNFNKIFKFDKVIENSVLEREHEIKSMNFIDDGELFMDYLKKSKQGKNAMAKVLMQKRLDKIRSFSPEYIRKQITDHPELSSVKFNGEDKIIIDKKSFSVVVKILQGVINLDLITKELNGVEGIE